MSDLLLLRALLFAGECFAASVLLLGSAAVAVRFVKCASLRHLVWLTAFGTMLVLPLAALVVPPQIAIHQRAQTTPAFLETASQPPASVLPDLPPVQKPARHIGADDIALALFGLWLIGFGWSALRLLIGAIGINALSMSSRRIEDEKRREFPNVDGCDLRVADDRSGPMTWGTLRPVILLPNEARGWPPERLRAVLLHELAHVRRRDSLAQSVSRIACALYWPNPLAWIGARAMRRDAEMAADDAVIGAGVRPSLYARELLALAAAYRSAPGFAGAGLSMAAESRLETRVKSILGANGLRRGVRFMDIAKFAGVGVLAAAAFAFIRPSLAQDASPAAAVRVHAAPLVLAQNDHPPVPPAPDAPPAPPVPPTPHVPPVPPTPAVPPSPDTDYAIDMHGDVGQSMRDRHIEIRRMTPEERRKLHAILRNLHREIHDAMAKARPEMRHALAELQAHRAELEAIRPQIEQAMREAQPQIEQAMEEARRAAADAKIDARVRRHIEQAMRQMEVHMHDRRMDMHDSRDHAMDGSQGDDHAMGNPDPNPDPDSNPDPNP